MKYTMTIPCSECPFRRDRAGFLKRERAQQIANDLLAEGDQCRPFVCHKTIGLLGDNEQHCAGALIIMEKNHQSNLVMALAQRYAGLNLAKLDVGHPHVFHKMKEFIEHHARRLPGNVRVLPRAVELPAPEITLLEELPDEPQWRPVGK
jgi:hypothetical protein